MLTHTVTDPRIGRFKQGQVAGPPVGVALRSLEDAATTIKDPTDDPKTTALKLDRQAVIRKMSDANLPTR